MHRRPRASYRWRRRGPRDAIRTARTSPDFSPLRRSFQLVDLTEDLGRQSAAEGAHGALFVARSSRRVEEEYGGRLERMAQEGFDVTVLAGADGGLAKLAARGVETSPIPVTSRLNVPGLVGAFFIVQAEIIEQRPILVHGFGAAVGWLTAFAADRVDVPAVLVSLDAPPTDDGWARDWAVPGRMLAPRVFERLEGPIVEQIDRVERSGVAALYERLGRRVDRVLVSSEGALEYLADATPIPRSKFELVVGGRGVDVDRFDPESLDSPDDIRQRLGLPDAWRHVVGYAGPLQPDRGTADLIDAIDLVDSRRGGVGWLLVSEASPAGEVERRLSRLRDRGRVRLLDDDDPRFYRALDLFAFPRAARSVPLSVMRAQAMAIPALAYASAATETVVAEGQTGHLIPVEERDELGRAIDELLDRPRRLRDYGVRARSRATGRFDRRHVDEQVLRLYDRLLERKLEGGS